MAAAPHHHIQRASRELYAVVRGATSTHYYLRNRLLAIFWVTVAIGILSTVVVWLAERHAHGTQIHNLWDAFLFAMPQLLTASSVASPTSDFGKVLELLFDIYALTVVATLAGSFGSFFHRRSQEHDAARAAAASTAAAAASGPPTPAPSP